MTLMAKGIGRGDAVFCPAFTFCATAEAAALIGATPVFVDVQAETFNIDPESLKTAIATAKAAGLKAKAVIPVDLFGLPADHDAVAAIAKQENLFVLDDAAQGFGATYKGRTVGALAPATATSFFPAKPLGCYGDGGAVLTDDDELAATLKSLRVHGQGADKYDNVRIGMTGAARHHPGGGPDREAENLSPTRSRRATASPAAIRGLLDDAVTCPAVAGGLYFGLGAIHHPAASRHRATRSRRRCRPRASRPRSIMPSRCTGRPPIGDFPVAGGRPCRSPSGSPTRSSACRCTPISTTPTQDRIVDAVRRAVRAIEPLRFCLNHADGRDFRPFAFLGRPLMMAATAFRTRSSKS